MGRLGGGSGWLSGEGLCVSLLTSFQVRKTGLWCPNQICFYLKWGSRPGLQTSGNQGGVHPAVMATRICSGLHRKDWNLQPRGPGAQEDVAMGKLMAVPRGTLQSRSRKGPDFGPAAPFQSSPLPGSVSWVWPKLGFSQVGWPPGGFGTDSWDVMFPALKRWRLETGPRWGWSLECRAPQPWISAGQWGHGWAAAGWKSSGKFPRAGMCQSIRARWSHSLPRYPKTSGGPSGRSAGWPFRVLTPGLSFMQKNSSPPFCGQVSLLPG